MAKEKQPDNPTPSRVQLVSAVINPMGFYVLTLLIGEAFLGFVLLSPAAERAGLTSGLAITGTVAFVAIVAVVVVLSIWNREALFFGRDEVFAERLRKLEIKLSHYVSFDSEMAEIRELMKMGRYEAARQRSESLAADRTHIPKVPKKAEALVQQAIAIYEEAKLDRNQNQRTTLFESALNLFKQADDLANSKKAVYLRPVYNCVCILSLLGEYNSALEYLHRGVTFDKDFTQSLCSDESDLIPLFRARSDKFAEILRIPREVLKASLSRVGNVN